MRPSCRISAPGYQCRQSDARPVRYLNLGGLWRCKGFLRDEPRSDFPVYQGKLFPAGAIFASGQPIPCLGSLRTQRRPLSDGDRSNAPHVAGTATIRHHPLAVGAGNFHWAEIGAGAEKRTGTAAGGSLSISRRNGTRYSPGAFCTSTAPVADLDERDAYCCASYHGSYRMAEPAGCV